MRLWRRSGWGSAIVEHQLALYGIPFQPVEVADLFQSADAREKLGAVNPVAQIPTLELPDGTVLTESAAITLWLADHRESDLLVPPADAVERAPFLRWLIFIVANIYPCFTFADDPARFVSEDAARQPFRAAVNAHAEQLWRIMEAQAGAPWFLGSRLSAIDVYLLVMTRWRPGSDWFGDHAPRLFAIREQLEADPRLAASLAANRDPQLS